MPSTDTTDKSLRAPAEALAATYVDHAGLRQNGHWEKGGMGMLIKLDLASGLIIKPRFRGVAAAVLVMALGVIVVGCGESEMSLPEEKPGAVVKKFYEYISEAKIRGGNLLIREAYKLTSSKESQQGQAKFIEIINKYPSGFRAEVVSSTVDPGKRHAEVAIEYKVGSRFGDAVTVRTAVQLNVDKETNTWRIDFTGETDGLDLAKLRAEESTKDPIKTVAGGEKK